MTDDVARTISEPGRALRAHRWRDARLDEATQRFVTAALEQLADTLGDRAVDEAAVHACASAQRAAPGANAAHDEARARLALALAAREVLRVGGAPHAPEAASLRAAVALAVAAATSVPRANTAACKLHAVDRVTRSARKALLEARDRTLAEHGARAFVVAGFDQLAHGLTLFAARGPRAELVVAEAVRAAGELARRSSARGWLFAAPAEKRALAQRCVLEVAGTLAVTAASALDVSPDGDDAALWLARTATQIAACAARPDAWFPDPALAAVNATDEPDAQRTRSNKTSDARPRATEASVKEASSHAVIKTLQLDATDAAWRTAGSQFVKLAREPLVGVLSRHLGPDDDALRGRIAAFLETPIGGALLASVLAAGLSALPGAAGEVPQRIARELRVKALADAGDLLADVLMGPLRQVMATYLQDASGLVIATPAVALPDGEQRATVSSSTVAEREPARS